MFLSKSFREIFVNVTGTRLELYDTDGSVGAARGAALGVGFFSTEEEAFASLTKLEEMEPNAELTAKYQALYQDWKQSIDKHEFYKF